MDADRVVDAIFVVRGAEFSAVKRGLKVSASHIAVHGTALGAGPARAAARTVSTGGPPAKRFLIAGLCGGLVPDFAVGDVLLYASVNSPHQREVGLDAELTAALQARVPQALSGVRGFSAHHVLTSAGAKGALARSSAAQAVDLESYALAAELARRGCRVAVIRIVSDAFSDALPDLGKAIDASGELRGPALAWAMLRAPRAGFRLARNGTRALRVLTHAIGAIAAGS